MILVRRGGGARMEPKNREITGLELFGQKPIQQCEKSIQNMQKSIQNIKKSIQHMEKSIQQLENPFKN